MSGMVAHALLGSVSVVSGGSHLHLFVSRTLLVLHIIRPDVTNEVRNARADLLTQSFLVNGSNLEGTHGMLWVHNGLAMVDEVCCRGLVSDRRPAKGLR